MCRVWVSGFRRLGIRDFGVGRQGLLRKGPRLPSARLHERTSVITRNEAFPGPRRGQENCNKFEGRQGHLVDMLRNAGQWLQQAPRLIYHTNSEEWQSLPMGCRSLVPCDTEVG